MTAPRLKLPKHPYHPGVNQRPDACIFEPFKTLPSPASIDALRDCATLSAGFEAFHVGYFWEAHELWEPVWMALPDDSAEKALMQGLIQLANAGLKAEMGKPRAVRRILERADAALAHAFAEPSAQPLGLDRELVESFKVRIANLRR